MKKIFPASIIALLLVSVLVSAQSAPKTDYNPETGKLTIKLLPGWNLVPAVGTASSENTCGAYLGTSQKIFYYSSTEKKFLEISPGDSINDPSAQTLKRDMDAKYYYVQPALGAAFVYRQSECSFSTEVPKLASAQINQVSSVINQLKIAKGWNIITIHPWMLDKNLSEFIGTCNPTRAFAFNSALQRWNGGPITKQDLQSAKVTSSEIGQVLALNFESDCNFELKTTSPPNGPPLLPD